MQSPPERNIHDSWPLVSVIVPFFNGELYLGSALQSIREQDYRPLEVIAVDDGSTDGSAEVAKSFKEVLYIYQTNRGYPAAKNTGISAARGEFLAFLDADDLWVPDKLLVQVGYMMKHPECGITVGRMNNFIDKKFRSDPDATNSPLMREETGLGTLVARKEVFERVGFFDPNYEVGSDLDWFIRTREAGIHMEILPETLLHRRIHDCNVSSNINARRSYTARMLKASIDRKRKQD